MKTNIYAIFNYIVAIINFITFIHGIILQNYICFINLVCVCVSLYCAYLCDKEYAKYLLNKFKEWLQK